jgi:peptidyl-prolyl cis-trans isomerase C
VLIDHEEGASNGPFFVHHVRVRWVLLLSLMSVGCAKPPASSVEPLPTPRPGAAATALRPESEPPTPEPREPRCTVLEVCLAQVGDVQIPYQALDDIYALKVKKYTDRGREIPDSAARRYKRSISSRLIYHEVLAQECNAVGVEYDAAALEQGLAERRRGIREWETHLERRGESEASLREMFIAEARERALLEAQGVLEVSSEEVAADYEKIRANWRSDHPRVRASHILLRIEDGVSEADVKAKAKAMAKLAQAADADFAALAKEHSVGPSAKHGGDIGIFTADRMAEPFSKKAFSMKVGEVSGPVRTKFGFHIIKLTGRWPPGALPMSAIEDQIRSRLIQRKLHEGRRIMKEELLRRYEIVDNMEASLGPEPSPRERRRPHHGDDALPRPN